MPMRDAQTWSWHIGAEARWPPFTNDIFQMRFLNENYYILIQISLKTVPKGGVDYKQALVKFWFRWWLDAEQWQAISQYCPKLLRHICITRPQCSLPHSLSADYIAAYRHLLLFFIKITCLVAMQAAATIALLDIFP